MSEAPWIRFFPSDWLAGTRGMSAAETGVYITLIAMMYEAKAPIRDDEARLSRLCGLPPASFRKILKTLIGDGKISSDGGCIWNRRVAAELGIRDEKTESARRSANSRWAKNTNKSNTVECDRIAGAEQTQCYPEARSQKEEDSSLRSLSRPVDGDTDHAQIDPSDRKIVDQGTEPKRAPARPPVAPAEHEAFPEFWAAYPKRYGTNSRAGAAEKFRVLVRSGIDPPALIAGAERYRRQCEARGIVGSEFVQQATTWLNPKNRAWEEAYDLPDPQKQPIRRDRDDTLRDGAGRAVDPIVAAVMHRRSLRGDRGRPADPDPGFDLDGEGGAPPADRVDRGRGFASVVRGCDRGGGRPPVDDAAQGWR